MRILALDLGTKTGWAIYDNCVPGHISAGTWKLIDEKSRKIQAANGSDRSHDLRFLSLQQKISDLLPLDHIYFEDVEFNTYTYQCQLWAGLRTVVSLFYPGQVSFITAVPVGTLKKFATGKGNANKEAMGWALFRQNPRLFEAKTAEAWGEIVMDDNEVDARHLLNYALWQLKIKIPQS